MIVISPLVSHSLGAHCHTTLMTILGLMTTSPIECFKFQQLSCAVDSGTNRAFDIAV